MFNLLYTQRKQHRYSSTIFFKSKNSLIPHKEICKEKFYFFLLFNNTMEIYMWMNCRFEFFSNFNKGEKSLIIRIRTSEPKAFLNYKELMDSYTTFFTQIMKSHQLFPIHSSSGFRGEIHLMNSRSHKYMFIYFCLFICQLP